ncbi:tetratricopeptide repeat protein [candidate division KSB1 bacterium]
MKTHNISIFLTALIFIILHIFGKYSNSAYVWGVDQWRYFPAEWTVVFTVVCLVVLIPFINRKMTLFVEAVSGFIGKITSKIWRSLSFGILLFICIELFLNFRVKTHFLGDGYVRMRNLERLSEFQIKNVLDIYDYVNFNIYSFLQSIIKTNSLIPFVLIGVLCGILFVFVSIYLSKQFKQSAFLFLLLVFTGTMQLYFGYVEIYAISTLLVLLYIYLSIRCLKNDVSFYYPLVVLLAGIVFHASVLFLIPSGLYLVWFHHRDRLLQRKRIFIALSGLFLFAAVFYLLFNGREHVTAFLTSEHILPVNKIQSDIKTAYSLFSFSHAADVLNGYLLAAPVFIFTLMLIIVHFKTLVRKIEQKGIFLLTAVLGYSVFTFFINFEIGVFRDWDLFSPAALPLVVFTFLIIIEYLPYEPKKLLFILSIYSIVHTVPWILINSSEEKSLERFLYLTDHAVLSPHASGYANDELRAYYTKQGEPLKMLAYAERAYKAVQSDRYLYNISVGYYAIGNNLFKKGDLKSAEGYYLKGLNFYENNPHLHNRLGILYMNTGRYAEALKEFKLAAQINPGLTLVYNNLGNYYSMFGDRRKAVESFKKALEVNPNIALVHYNLATEYEKNEKGVRYGKGCDLDNAMSSYRKALSLDEGMVMAHFNLAALYSEIGQDNLAESEYKRVMELSSDYPLVYKNLVLIYERRGEYKLALEYINKANSSGIEIEPAVYKRLQEKLKSKNRR